MRAPVELFASKHHYVKKLVSGRVEFDQVLPFGCGSRNPKTKLETFVVLRVAQCVVAYFEVWEAANP